MLRRAFQRGRLAIALCTAVVTTSLPISAQTPSQAIRNLLQSVERPTVAEVKAATGNSTTNPFKALLTSGLQARDLVPNFEDKLSDIIVQLEMLYPGATYAPLGRDVVWLGDALDAYYESIGQPGRVSRLNASTPTLANIKQSTMIEFLRAAGFSPEDIQTAPPFVMFDRSEFRNSGGARQLARLVDAGYTKLIELHGPAKAQLIVEKLNAFAINGQLNSSLWEVNNTVEANRLIDSQITAVKSGNVPRQIALQYNTLAGALVDTQLDWHDSFDSLTTVNGKLQGSIPGSGYTRDVKSMALYYLYEIMQCVSAPSFHALVESKARKHKVKISPTRLYPNPFETVPLDIEVAAKEYEELVTSLPTQADEISDGQYFSPNAQMTVGWLDRRLPAARLAQNEEHLLMLFTEGFVVAMNTSKLTRKDKRRLVAKMLATVAEETQSRPSNELVAWFQEFYEQEKELQDVWTSRSQYFLDADPDRRGGEAVPEMYKLLSGKIGSCTPGTNCPVPIETLPDFCRHLFGDKAG